MPRDYTKFNIEGLGENLNKRQLVFTIIKDFIDKNNPTFDLLKSTFPDTLQGGKYGVIIEESETYDPTRFTIRTPLKINGNISVVVSNQWGDNIYQFIAAAQSLGYNITLNSPSNESFSNEDEIHEDEDCIQLSYFNLEIPFPKNVDKIIINVTNQLELIYENLGERIIIHYDVKNNAILKHNHNESEPTYEYLNVYEADIPESYEDLKAWMGDMIFTGELDNQEWSLSNHGGSLYDKINVSNDLEEALIINFNEKNMYKFINEIINLT